MQDPDGGMEGGWVGDVGIRTPPPASCTTRTKELPLGTPGAEHLLYNVVRLTPSPSRL